MSFAGCGNVESNSTATKLEENNVEDNKDGTINKDDKHKSNVNIENNDNTVSNDEMITVYDMLGDSVVIKKNPKKVACVSRTTYDLLIAFGLGDYIDGAYYAIYHNPWVELIYPDSKDEYRYAYEENYETFISRNIDLVFAPEKYIADGLKEHDINALCISLYGNPTFDQYVYFFADVVKQIWDSKEVEEKVNAWKEKVDKAVNEINDELAKHDIPKKSLYYVRGDKNKGIGYTDTKAAFTEYAYRKLGFDFVSSNFKSNKPSEEEICVLNPDVFVIGGIYQNLLVETLKTTEPYTYLESVKNNQIYTIPVGFTMFEQLSAMTPVFFYNQANKLYPEYFNYDITTMVKKTVKEYFGTELSELQIEMMLNGKNSNGKDMYEK